MALCRPYCKPIVMRVMPPWARALERRRCEPELAAAIEYAVLAPGKRLRPALVRLANQCIGGAL